MSEGKQLVPQDMVGGALAKDEDFADMVTAGSYLPRLQLFGSKSDACAEGRIPIGHYGLVKDDDITDLGDEINIVIVSWRTKATQVGGDMPIIVFDAKSELFQRIKEQSTVRDSGCMYGPEFLVWVPDAETFATYHMNSKTARREAKKMRPLIGSAATLKCRLIDPPTSKYKWHGPVILPCSTPLSVPDDDKMRVQWTQFQNPPEPVVLEEAEEGDERAR